MGLGMTSVQLVEVAITHYEIIKSIAINARKAILPLLQQCHEKIKRFSTV